MSEAVADHLEGQWLSAQSIELREATLLKAAREGKAQIRQNPNGGGFQFRAVEEGQAHAVSAIQRANYAMKGAQDALGLLIEQAEKFAGTSLADDPIVRQARRAEDSLRLALVETS